MSIVKATNKKTGITYVYESESYWDKEKKQPRNRRKLIGKIDPETGEVVPTRKRAPRAGDGTEDADSRLQELRRSYEETMHEFEEKIRELELELSVMRKEKEEILKGLKALIKAAEE